MQYCNERKLAPYGVVEQAGKMRRRVMPALLEFEFAI